MIASVDCLGCIMDLMDKYSGFLLVFIVPTLKLVYMEVFRLVIDDGLIFHVV